MTAEEKKSQYPLSWAAEKPYKGVYESSEYCMMYPNIYLRRVTDVWGLGMVFLYLLSKVMGLPHAYDDITETMKNESFEEGLSRVQSLLDMMMFKHKISEEEGTGTNSTLQILLLVNDLLAEWHGDRPNIKFICWVLCDLSHHSKPWCGTCCLSRPNLRMNEIWRFVFFRKTYAFRHFTLIGRMLMFSNVRWARNPRTFILDTRIRFFNGPSPYASEVEDEIMQWNGKEDSLTSILEDMGVSDIWLPYKPSLLRHMIKEPALRDIIEFDQRMLMSYMFKHGEHNHFLNGDDHFEVVKELGSGGYGSVAHVIENQSKQELARKLIPRVHQSRNRATEVTNVVQREINILKRVNEHRHRHLVYMVGSYTDLEDFGILFSPLGDMNLQEYMGAKDTSEDFGSNITRWFLCLANALSFLHRIKIR